MAVGCFRSADTASPMVIETLALRAPRARPAQRREPLRLTVHQHAFGDQGAHKSRDVVVRPSFVDAKALQQASDQGCIFKGTTVVQMPEQNSRRRQGIVGAFVEVHDHAGPVRQL